MSEDRVEELLVEWEMARRDGREIETHVLCKECPELSEIVEKQIQVLKQSAWMLQDPAPAPYSEDIVQSLSRLTYNEERESETLLSSLLETSAFDPSDIHEESTKSAGAVDLYEIPGFQLEQELGRGGFGIVYRAYDETLHRSVAIKIPLLNDVKSRARYLSEARNAAKVEVSGIVPVLQVGTTNEGVPFVVQKLIEGKSLAQILKTGAQISPRQVSALLVDVCHALGAAHAEALIHRDLKPGNIMVDKAGKPWVTDFGLAITEDEQLKRRGEIAGTPSYMSPEQLEGKVDWCDGRTDIWALGVILYQSLTGRMPFRGQNRNELKDQILHREPRPICQRDPQLAKEWDIVFSRCCAKSMNDRYHNTFDLAIDLERIPVPEAEPSEVQGNYVSHQSFAKSGISGSFQSAATQTQESATRNWLGWISAIALLVIAVSTVGLLWNNFGTSTSNLPTAPSSEKLSELFVGTSTSGTNHFSSLGEALAAASEEAELRLEPGVYEGNFKINGKVRFSSSVPGEKFTLVGKDGPALSISPKATVYLADANLKTDSTEPVNTVEVKGGKLLLVDCYLESTGYNAIMAEADSEVVIDDCDFLVRDDHAIVADEVAILEVEKSNFKIEPSGDKLLAGVQTLDCVCHVAECDFKTTPAHRLLACGVYIEDSDSDSVVTDSTFECLSRGILLINSSQVRIGGVESTFSDCLKSIDLKASQADIRNCVITGTGLVGSVGIQIDEMPHSGDTPVAVSKCNVKLVETGVLISQAKVNTSAVDVTESSVAGVRVLEGAELDWSLGTIANNLAYGIEIRSGKAAFKQTRISDNSITGVLLDSIDMAATLDSSAVTGNPVGLIIVSGGCQLRSTDVIESETGVLLARKHQLLQEPTCDSPLMLRADEHSFIGANRSVIHFLSPGSMTLNGCGLNGGETNSATCADNLEKEQSGDGEISYREVTGPKA